MRRRLAKTPIARPPRIASSAAAIDRPPAPERLADGAKRQPAQDRADIVDHGDAAHRVVAEMALLLQEGRIKVLRAVAEEIERRHQQRSHTAPASNAWPTHAEGRDFGGALALEGRRFRHFAADVENEQRRHERPP